MRALSALLFALLLAAPAAAEEARAKAVIDNWRAWAAERGADKGQIVVLQDGEPLARAAMGGSEGPLDLASLAKAVTGVCLARLVEEGRLAWTDRVGDWVKAEAPLADVRLAALVTHTSGLAPDQTQGWMPALRGAGAPAYRALVDRIGDRPLGAAKYRYNNENYGVLGAVIAAAGAPYAEVCATPGLTPSPTYGRFAAWGGWRGDLADYGRFHWAAFGGMDPAAAPSAPAYGEEVRYGLGAIFRAFRGGHNYWHFGALCFADGDNFFTHAVLFSDGFGVVSHVEGCPGEGWFLSLDEAIVRGAFAQ